MKKLFVCAATIGLFVFPPAAAEHNDHRGDKDNAAASHVDHGSNSAGSRQNGQGHAAPPQFSQGRPTIGNTRAMTNVHPDMSNGTVAGRTNTRSIGVHRSNPAINTSTNLYLPKSGDVNTSPQGGIKVGRGQNGSGWSGNTTNHQPVVNFRQGNARWSGNAAGHQSDVNAMRRNTQASARFHSGSYNAPQGYHVRHWGYGEQLPRLYYARNYWISDFMTYDLFSPPSGLVWVRVGDDALLIDQDTGDIVQVRYGVFY